MDNLIPALVFFFVMAITPGPNNFMIMSSGINYGFRRSLPHLFGIILGFPMLIIGIGFGLDVAFSQLPWLQQFIKYIGVIVLIYLAYRIATTSKGSSEEGSKPLTFIQVVLFQWVNPKAVIMTITGISVYTNSGDVQSQVLTLAASNILVTVPSASVWLFLGLWLQKVLTNPVHLKLFNQIMALLLLGSIVPIFI
ncbi:MAG: LysE family translocator [PS1 clade bacterium]|jgi:threonine/homoserine/homoserine lactone efflux protein